MHRLRSSQTAWCFRIAALLFCAVILLMGVSLSVLTIAVVISDSNLVAAGLACGGLAVIGAGMRWHFASHAKCPLCLTPVLIKRHCSKHRRARKILGSHRLRVALSILFRNSFRCQYCNEPTAIIVRQRNPNSHPPGRR